MSVEQDGWVRCRTPRPRAGTAAACFPHAGGSATFFAGWGSRARADLEIAAVQYPGRGERIDEPPPASLAALVAGAAAELAGEPRPLVLFGHSLGAIVAYEVARVLAERYDREPAHLVVSGRRGPTVAAADRAVHRLPDDGLVAELTRLGGTPTDLFADAEARAVFLPAVRADFRIAETYRHLPGPRLSCPVTAVIGDADTEVDAPGACGWAEVTTGPFALHVRPGGHFYLVAEAASVLDLLAEVPAGARA